MANGHGGRRTGTGRKKGIPNKKTKERRIIEAQAHEVFVNMVLAKYKPLIEALLKEGEGNYSIITKDKEGNPIKQPDGRLILDTFSYVISKPKVTTENNVTISGVAELDKKVAAILDGKKKND